MEVIHYKKKVNKENIFANKLKVAAYVRVSTRSDIQLNSFESQLNYYTNLISRNSNWTLYKIYSDFGKSGTSITGRKEFIEMINDAMKGKIDFIITKSVSRLARNTEDLLKIVRTLKEKNIGIYFEEENINTLALDGEFLLSVLASVAQTEAENTKSHINFSMKRKMENGDCLTRARTFGYKYDSGNLKLVKKEAKVVKKMFELYSEGNSLKEITKYLNDNKIKTLFNNKWSSAGVHAVLKNSIYTGDLIQGRYFTTNTDNLYIIKEHHAPIVSKELYEKVQEKFKASEKWIPKKEYLKNIHCGLCGRKLVYIVKVNGSFPYLCCRYKGCKALSTKKEVFESIFIDLLFKIVNLDLSFDKYKNKYKEYNDLLKKYSREKIILLDELIDSKINKYKYNEELKKLSFKIEEVEVQKANLEKYKVLENKGREIKTEIINRIIDFTDDINIINYDLYYDIILFTLIGRVEKVRTNNSRVIRFFYNDKNEFIKVKIDNYLEYANNFELLFDFQKKVYIRNGWHGYKNVKYQVEFYIRKDY